MDEHVVIPVIVALIASLPGVLAFVLGRRKQLAEQNSSVLTAYRQFIDPLREEVDDLRRIAREQGEQLDRHRDRIADLEAENERHQQRIAHLEQENERLFDGVQKLIEQLQKNNLHPVWSPASGWQSGDEPGDDSDDSGPYSRWRAPRQ